MPKGPLYRIPNRYLPTYEEGKLFARLEREMNPDHRTKTLAETSKQRKERDQKVKIAKTMQIAREWTAQRAATTSAHSQADASSPSPTAPAFDAKKAAKWQRKKGKPEPVWWAKKAAREADAIEQLIAAGRPHR